MPRTRSLAWAELKIGVISLFAVVMTTIMIFLLSGEGGFAWQQYHIKTTFTNIAGLKPGAPVRVAGVEVGSVSETQFIGDRVEVVMEVNADYRHLITNESVASLGSVSLLGEAAVDLTAAGRGTPIPEWGYVRSGRAAGSIGDVATQATEGIEQLTAVLTDIQQGRGTVGQLFINDSLYKELNNLLAAAADIAKNVKTGRGTLGRLTNDPTAARSLEGALANLEAVTAGIRKGEGSIGKLLNDDAFSRSLTTTTANIDAITGRINRGEGSVGAALNERQLYDRINAIANRLDQVTTALQQGEGTAGLLLKDKQLYENINSAVSDVRKLVAAITADPKKYLTVRVSIF